MKDLKKPNVKNEVCLQKQKNHIFIAFITIFLGVGALAFAMAISITKGASQIPLKTVWEALFHFDIENTHHLVILDLRLPRTIASALVGAALAVAGAIMQGTTRNPMADSGLMGLNAGAGFALSICFSFFSGMSYRQIMICAFLGAALGAVLVNGIASLRRGGATPMRLVLAGAAVSALLTALSQGISLYFDTAQDILFWSVGGVAGCDWEQVKIITPWILIGLFGAIILSRRISLLSLGEDVAKGLGLNMTLVNFLCAMIVLILAGAAVSVVGAVGFVGLLVPHLARFVVGVDYRYIIPVSAVLGALLVVLADIFARTINPSFETPLGAIISLLGVPFFLYLARKQRRTL